jgi:hypothetical protein
MAQLAGISASKIASHVQNPVTWVFVERVTRIELALSAREVGPPACKSPSRLPCGAWPGLRHPAEWP